MGFLGLSGDMWKKIGHYAIPAAAIAAAPFTGGSSLALLALGAGAGAASGALDGGWKGAAIGAGLGAIPGGTAASGIAGMGAKEIAKNVATGAATNFATGTATNLATGHDLGDSLKAGGSAALSGVGTTGGATGVKSALTDVAKNTALNVGTAYAGQGLQKAGVSAPLAQTGANVFNQYLGGKLAPSANPAGTAGVGGVATAPAKTTALKSLLPQNTTGGTDWRSLATNAALGAAGGAAQGGGVKGALTGAATGALGTGGGGGGSTPAPASSAGVPRGAMAFGAQNTGGPTLDNPSVMQAPAAGPAAQRAAEASVANPGAAAPTGTAPGQDAQAQGAQGFWGKYGPLIAQGTGVAAGAWAGKKATDMAQQRSPEEQAALTGAQGVADQSRGYGAQAFQAGQDYSRGPANYYQTLLSGNRAQMSQMVAPAVAQITGNYRGAERALEHSGVRGAQRDAAVADLNRQRASQIAGLTTGVQPAAAAGLAGLSGQMLGVAPGLLGQAGAGYGNLLQQGYANREYARKEGEKTATAIGGLARDAGEVVWGKKGQTPTTDPASATTAKKKPATTGQNQGGAGTPQAPAPLPFEGPLQGYPVTQPSAPVYQGDTPAPLPSFQIPGGYDPYGSGRTPTYA